MTNTSRAQKVAAAAHTYSVGNGSYTSAALMIANLSALQPCSAYSYQVSCCNSNDATPACNQSDIFNFTTAPDASCSSGGVNVSWAVFGDMGTVVPFGYAVTKMIVEGMRIELCW